MGFLGPMVARMAVTLRVRHPARGSTTNTNLRAAYLGGYVEGGV